MDDKAQISIRLDRDVLSRIDEIAAEEHAGRSFIIRRLLRQSLPASLEQQMAGVDQVRRAHARTFRPVPKSESAR
jgi:predicted transcriptional regulator